MDLNDIDDIKKHLNEALKDLKGKTVTTETTQETAEVLIPIIRKIMPAMLAQQIVGVQPMSMSASYPYKLESVDDGETVFSYWVRVNTPGFYSKLDTTLEDMDAWCEESLVKDAWYRHQNTFKFCSDADRTMFTLRWS